jgi:hypothetical protein
MFCEFLYCAAAECEGKFPLCYGWNRLRHPGAVMKIMRQILTFGAILLIAVAQLTEAFAAEVQAARFDGKDTLLRPIGYREWIFVGSSLGLQYADKDEKKRSDAMEFKNIYINPEAYRAYVKTGQFPQGTILVLETLSGETKQEPGLSGAFQKEFVGLSAAVKDRTRFEVEWAYFSFSDRDGKPSEKAQPSLKSACFDCHRKKGATDNVFTQFYPVLRAVSSK